MDYFSEGDFLMELLGTLFLGVIIVIGCIFFAVIFYEFARFSK